MSTKWNPILWTSEEERSIILLLKVVTIQVWLTRIFHYITNVWFISKWNEIFWLVILLQIILMILHVIFFIEILYFPLNTISSITWFSFQCFKSRYIYIYLAKYIFIMGIKELLENEICRKEWVPVSRIRHRDFIRFNHCSVMTIWTVQLSKSVNFG